VLPANGEATANITAFVVNAYGDPLQSKTVNFAVTAGDGSVSPAFACTTSSGTASTVFTAGSSTGTAVITATATNDAC
jgi:hypothetical protein